MIKVGPFMVSRVYHDLKRVAIVRSDGDFIVLLPYVIGSSTRGGDAVTRICNCSHAR